MRRIVRQATQSKGAREQDVKYAGVGERFVQRLGVVAYGGQVGPAAIYPHISVSYKQHLICNLVCATMFLHMNFPTYDFICGLLWANALCSTLGPSPVVADFI